MSEYLPAQGPAKDALEQRYWRKVEVLWYCTKYKGKPIEKILGKISGEPNHLNSGASITQMKIYLKEYEYGDFGVILNHTWIIAIKGENLLKKETAMISKYFHKLDDFEEEIKK